MPVYVSHINYTCCVLWIYYRGRGDTLFNDLEKCCIEFTPAFTALGDTIPGRIGINFHPAVKANQIPHLSEAALHCVDMLTRLSGVCPKERGELVRDIATIQEYQHYPEPDELVDIIDTVKAITKHIQQSCPQGANHA